MTQMTSSPPEAQETDFLRHLFIPVYLPAILFATGEGALIPVVPLTARALGANMATAGIISGLLMIGVVIGDLPSGFVVAKWGETFAMSLAATIAIISAIVCRYAPNLPMLAAGVLMIGIASATFNLARHAFLTAWTPSWYRARAMSMLGGTSRIGYFIGPFIASPVIALTGSHSVYWIHVVACVAVLVALKVMPDPEQVLSRNRAKAESRRSRTHTVQAKLDATTAVISPTATAANPSPSGRVAQDLPSSAATAPTATTADATTAPIATTEPRRGSPIARYFTVLIRLGSAAGILQMMRASRQVILPLWGVHLGISSPHIALIMGIAGAVDLSLFYTSGQVMDRFGRRWAAVPVLLGIGLGHLLIPLATAEWGYIAVAIVISLANGLGSGIVMTLGADLASRYAPKDMPGFLGAWRTFTDSGSALGPLSISAMTALTGLPAAAVLIGCCGLVGAFLMQRYIPRILG
ncbi:MFS transporter [Bifidobacterium mongoliense]|uniref:MFS transporter n=2 Tax=Bifidobacterium mongoliense TaxID=518643 RepID=UPI002647C196|nr:MFS transporter [Bifidobacterium mongoliense]MDN6050765.1 MFS transporter [Bifidobacterium mongoliense]MDN6719319.1 MFS transporter [Bifidobacterium mongoliense]